jgi:glycosyltransferase involved in cell wall biosynthesis
MKPIVSAIVSTYNAELFIKKRIENLLQQSIADKIEIIIINSGSLQNEENIIQMFLQNHQNIKYIRTENRETIYKAWNRGISISTGTYITNANTDDILRNDALEIMTRVLDSDKTIGMVYADQFFSFLPNQDFKTLENKIKYRKPNFTLLHLLERCIIGSQPVWRSSIHFEEGIWFDESYEIAGDYEFELKVAFKYKIQHVDDFLGIYYKSPQKLNKEFQNFENTFKETYTIMDYFCRKFISQAPPDKIAKLIKKLYALCSFIPQPLYNVCNKIHSKLNFKKPMHERYFLIWFLSLYFEMIGDSFASRNWLMRHLGNSSLPLLKKRLSDLNEFNKLNP